MFAKTNSDSTDNRLFLSFEGTACACSCAFGEMPAVEERVENGQVAFQGVTTNKLHQSEIPEYKNGWRFTVRDSVNWDGPSEIKVISDQPFDGNCGATLEVGAETVILLPTKKRFEEFRTEVLRRTGIDWKWYVISSCGRMTVKRQRSEWEAFFEEQKPGYK